jgi:hypothetical protein
MARRRKPNEEQEIDLPYPLDGLEENRGFMHQRPGTTVNTLNCRSFEPFTGRARGGQRSGTVKFVPNAPNPGMAIQDLNHLTITAETAAPANSSDSFSYSQGTSNGLGIAAVTTGVSEFSGLAATSGYVFMCSTWDNANNLYVAMVNQTTGVVLVYCIGINGNVVWTNNLLSVATGTNRNVNGLAYMQVAATGAQWLFIAVTTTNAPFSAPTSTACKIHRLNAVSGAIDTLAWQSSGIYQGVATGRNLFFSTAAHNCLCVLGTTLAVDCCGASSGSPNLTGFNGSLAGQQANLFQTPYPIQTQSMTPVKIVTDGTANFYCLPSTATGQIVKIGLSGILQWAGAQTATDPCRSICYDSLTNQLITLCTNSPYLRSINITTGALTPNVTSPLAAAYDEIDSDGEGNFVCWRNSQSTHDVVGINQSLGVSWGPSTLANAVHSGASVNKGVPAFPTPILGSRIILGMAVAGGVVSSFSSTGINTITNGAVLNAAAPVIFSAQEGENMYYADGVSYWYYNALTAAMTKWTPDSGTMPLDNKGGVASLIENWRGRILLAGFKANPNLYWASAQFDPFNWNTSPQTATVTEAVAGDTGLAGYPGGVINCMIPYTDDVCIFGDASAIWQLTGDPANGGTFDLVSNRIGIAWGRPWAIDPLQQIYFFSTRMGIFKMTPGALPVRMSQQIERRLENIDLSQTLVRLAWDVTNQGLWVFVTPIYYGNVAYNFFWEERTNAWWVDQFANLQHQPLAVHVFDGDTANCRNIMLGGHDGYIRIIGNQYPNDDGTPIQSFVFLGPLPNKDWDELLLKDIQATLNAGTDAVTWGIYVGETAENAYVSSPVATGTWNGNRNHVSYVRRSGKAIYVKLSSNTSWALERVTARFMALGKVRRRGGVGT